MEDDKNCIQDARGPWHKQAFSKSSVLINSKIVATHSDIRSLSFHFDTGPLLNLIINLCYHYGTNKLKLGLNQTPTWFKRGGGPKQRGASTLSDILIGYLN
jgi:hypothetical protein